MADHANAGGFVGEGCGAAIAGAVIHHDHLKGHAGGGIGQGRQAAPGHRVLVVHRHHHAHLGIGCDGQPQGFPGDGAALGARFGAWRQGPAFNIAVELDGVAEEPVQQAPLGREGSAIPIGPMQPGGEAAVVFAG